MNMVKSLYSKLAGANPKTELVTISGALLLVRQGNIKGSKECLFTDAVASIRKTSYDFVYELVITRSFADGEEQLLEEDDENEEEFSFILDEALRFGSMKASQEDSEDSGAYAFTWDDVSGDVDDTYRFITRGRPEVTLEKIQEFEDSVLRCIYERKFQKSSKGIAIEELEKLKSSRSPRKIRYSAGQRDSFSSSSDGEVANELVQDLSNLSVSNKPESTTAATATPSKSRQMAPDSVVTASSDKNLSAARAKEASEAAMVLPPDNRKLIAMETAELHLYDQATGSFMLQDNNVSGNLWRITGGKGKCWITVSGNSGENWVSTPISSDIPVTFIEHENAMTFNYQNPKTNAIYTWLLRFSNRESFTRVNVAFTEILFEESAGEGAWEKLKQDEQKYHQDAYLYDVEMLDDDYDEEEELEEEVVPYEEQESEEEEEEEGEDSEDEDAKPKKAKNSILSVGYKDELSFVVRGDMIGVFRSQPQGQKKLKFITNIQGLATPDGKTVLNPSKVLLHDQDRTMILKDPLNPHSLYKLDLTTGKVIDEWSISENFEISNFLPGSKFAQMTTEDTLLGTSRDAVFRIDPRLSKSKLVDSEYKKYATKQDFSSAATTQSGHLVLGSSKGHMKLFDALGKNAKTALPSLGDPIIGIDVTSDGRYVLATCPRYLLLIDTQINDGPNTGRSGFERSFPAAHKPTPKRLTLKPEHIAYINGDISFTPAKFDTGPDKDEKSIITSTGDFVIAWNLRRVKQGHLFDYKIRKFGQDIVADNFKFGGDREIIITTPADVFVEGKHGLQRPNRESLAGGIVQEY